MKRPALTAILLFTFALSVFVPAAMAAGKVNINAASAAELAKVPGLDPKIAVRIIARRTARGPFKTLDELTEIEGISKMSLISLVEVLEAGPAPAAATPAPSRKLDLNKATFSELLLLPDMTPRSAKAIVDYREKSGGFKSIDDLGNVQGLDKRVVITLFDQVTVSGRKGGTVATGDGGPSRNQTTSPTPANDGTATLGEEGWSGSWVSKLESQPTPAATPALASLAAGEKIDINSASRAQLERLPDIGPVLAQKIVEYRTANGPFREVDDLAAVRGVGTQRIASLRPFVTAGSVRAAATPEPAKTPRAVAVKTKATPRPTEVAMVRPVATPKPVPTAEPEAVVAKAAMPAITPDGRVNINVAGIDDLLTLPRMTRVVAMEIVEHREKNGPFRDSHGIVDVPSIGEAAYARMREKITVGN